MISKYQQKKNQQMALEMTMLKVLAFGITLLTVMLMGV